MISFPNPFLRWVLLTILATAVVGILFVWFRQEDGIEAVRERIIPQMEFRALDGRVLTLEKLNDTPMLVNIWASWCPFCLKEMTDFGKLEKKAEGKLKIVLVNRGEDTDTVKRSLDSIVGLASTTVILLDPLDALYPALGGFSMPETLFVSKDGIIRYHKRGPMQFEEMKRRAEDYFGL